MICVTIAEESVEKLRNAWANAIRPGVGLVEIRLDYLTEPADWTRILRDRPSPVLVTARRTIDGGRWAGDETQRRNLLDEAARNGAEWVDLEYDIAQAMPRTGVGRRLVSFHDMNATPENLGEIAQQCGAGDADLVKLAVMAHTVKDAFFLLNTVRKSHEIRPTMGLAMGDWGQFTRVVNACFGESWTYGVLDAASAPAPGMLSVKDLTEIYGYDRIDRSTGICAVIGDPISHSKSPLVHNLAFGHHGLKMVYVPIRIAAGDLDWFLEHFTRFGIRGLSVTIPHKENVIPALADMDELVRFTGSCNTVVDRSEGPVRRLAGYNTDLTAALDSLTEAIRDRTGNPELAGQKVLLLGAGGVARSLAFGLHHRGADLTIVNRSPERSESLASAVGAKAEDWNDRQNLAVQADILINATSLGMSPQVETSPLERSSIRPEHVVFDTIYAPEWTKFLNYAREAGAYALTGIDMFVRQAAVQSELFTGGLPAPVRSMASSLRTN
jgi:3-dehydroquinate dehydratase/shikimate dehydrogenase